MKDIIDHMNICEDNTEKKQLGSRVTMSFREMLDDKNEFYRWLYKQDINSADFEFEDEDEDEEEEDDEMNEQYQHKLQKMTQAVHDIFKVHPVIHVLFRDDTDL